MSRRRSVFEDVLYAQCWEDPALDREAFRLRPGDTVFSITSGGCNSLTFLLDDPDRVIALDINPHQNHLLALKIAAFRALSHDELLELVSVRDSSRRHLLYSRLRPLLEDESRGYWDGEPGKIAQGIMHCGRYEWYMKLLRTWIGRLMGRRLIERFFVADDPEERVRLFREEWENLYWWLITRVLLSRRTMSFLFDPAFFTYLDGSFSFGKHFAGRVEQALTRLPMKENYFLSYILLGRYWSEEHLPPYLRREHFETIRDRVDRIEIVTGICEEYFRTAPDSSITHFNFTNVFEWMSPEAYENLLRATWRVAQDGAVLTYRNLLVHREHPSSLNRMIASCPSLARKLHEGDLSFIYTNYVVERIRKRSAPWGTTSAKRATVAP